MTDWNLEVLPHMTSLFYGAFVIFWGVCGRGGSGSWIKETGLKK